MNRIDVIITHSGPFSFLGMASCTVLDALCRRCSKKSKTGEDKVIKAIRLEAISLRWEAVGDRARNAWSKTCRAWSKKHTILPRTLSWFRRQWPKDKLTQGIVIGAGVVLMGALFVILGYYTQDRIEALRAAHAARVLPVKTISAVKSVPTPQVKTVTPPVSVASVPVTPKVPVLVVPPPMFPVHYTVQRGDMVSTLAKKYYHDGTAWWSIAQANHLVAPDYWIYAGTIITIPAKELGRPNKIQGNAKQTISPKGNLGSVTPASLRTMTPITTIKVPVTTQPEAPEIVNEEPTTVELPVMITDITLPAPATKPELTTLASHAAFYPKKVSGYELIIPESASAGIPIMKELETCVVYSDSKDCKFKAWAQRTRDGDVSFKVSLKALPNRPFTLLVGGIANPINGEWFSSKAVPFGDRFPGPRKITEVMYVVAPIAVRFATTTLMTGNPYIGIGAALAPPAIQGAKALWHHAQKQKEIAHSKETIR